MKPQCTAKEWNISESDVSSKIIGNKAEINNYSSQHPTLLVIAVELRVGTNIVFTNALIDSACTANLIDVGLCSRASIEILPLPEDQIIVISSTIGSVKKQRLGNLSGFTVEIDLTIGSHSENIEFGVTSLSRLHPIVLGRGWLQKHNPEIDWSTNVLDFSRCTCVEGDVVIHAINIDANESPEISNDVMFNAAFASGADNPIPSEIPSKYIEFAHIFDEEASKRLPPHRPEFDCRLDFIDPAATPPNLKLIPLDMEKDKILKEFLDDQLSKGWIRRSTSPCAAPVFFVRKYPKGWRNCTDYRKLNEMLIKNRCPLPLISEMIDRITGSTIFTKIDLRNAYNQLRVRAGDEWKTAFTTKYGLYETLVMNFGLCNAPAFFQAWMNHIFHDILNVYVLVYLDDIIVYSTCKEDHVRHVREVLRRLHAQNCFVRLEKCVFDATEVEFVGFKIDNQGLHMCHKKVEAIQEWPTPHSKTSVMSFLGFINFYRRFLKGFSEIARPLTDITRKHLPFAWSTEADVAFQTLKRAVMEAPILRHIDMNKPFIIETDASNFATGAVLIQKDDTTGFPHPVAFTSKKLSITQVRYATYDKELFAIVRAFETWRHYLLSSPHRTLVFTDHNNLKYFRNRQILSQKQITWAMILSEFNFVLEHKAGIRNQVADALSRREDHILTEKEKLQASEGLVFRPDQFADSFSITANLVSGDSQSEGVPSEEDENTDEECIEIDSFPRDAKAAPEVISDERLKLTITRLRHDSVTAGHYGFNKTLKAIRRDFTWPGMHKYVKNYVASCECMRNKPVRHKPYGKLLPFPFATTPWTQVSLDFIVKLPLSGGFDSILVVCDRGMTKMVHFIPCVESIDAANTANLYMRHIFKLHGLPSQLISDRGPQFDSKVWEAIMKSLKVTVSRSTAYHPQSDGQSERSNQTLEQYLRNYVSYSQDDWIEYLHYAEFAFNNAVHEGIGISPFMAHSGYNPRADFLVLPTLLAAEDDNAKRLSMLKSIQEELQVLLREAQNNYKRFADVRRLESPFKVGDKVWLLAKHIRTKRPSRKLDHRRLGPFIILERINPEAWKLDLPPTLSRVHNVFHSSLLEPYIENEIPDRVIPPPPPVEIDDELEYVVEEILDSRAMGRGVQYLVKWKGHLGADSWEPSRHLTHCKELLQEFHRKHPNAKRTNKLRFIGDRSREGAGCNDPE
jgi:hypothetical protein